MKIKVKPWIQITGFILFFGLIILLNGLSNTKEIYQRPDPNIQITEIFPCINPDEREVKEIFSANVKRIYICAYQQKGGAGLYTVWWRLPKQFSKITNAQTNGNGWFYPVLEVGQDGLPAGVYTIEIKAGRSIQATTQFEVVSLDE